MHASRALLAVAAALVPTAAFADGWYLDGRLGGAYYNDREGTQDDRDAAYSFAGGYRFGKFGVELGYADQGRLSTAYLIGDADSEIDGVTLGVSARLPVSDRWHVDARAGAYLWDSSVDISSSGPGVAFTDDGVDPYVGVGFGYDLGKRWSLGMHYDYYAVEADAFEYDSGVVSLGAEVRF